MKHIPYIFIIAFGFGVLWRSFFDLGFYFSIFLLALAAILLGIAALSRHSKSIIISVVVLGVGLGVLRFDFADLNKGNLLLEAQINRHIEVIGVVIDEPDIRETNTKLTVLLESVGGSDVSEKMLIHGASHPEFKYGDRISISGELMKPSGFVADDGDYFAYDKFLGKDDIFYQMVFPEAILMSRGHGNFVKRTLFSVKNKFLESVEKIIPDPQSSLLGGLVVGAKQSLGEELQDDFRATGIIHIVVLSGYNVTIVAEALMRTFSFLPQAFGMALGSSAIVLFALMTGASATIVRASIMALLVIVARATGRTYAITRALFIAGFIMVLHNPKILIFDASFQLSFLATLGLIYLAPKIEKYFKFVPTRLQLREFAVATVATQIFVLPLLLYQVGELSLVSLPVNLLVLIVVPITMLIGFLTGVVGLLSVGLSLPFAFISYALLTYQLTIVDFFARLPFASVQIDNFPFIFVIVLYAFYGLLIWKLNKPK
ncbi:MAG: ComEC/Rec2 family competence protein [Candidatus Pacebacteria bacterium]|jgi:competence protein ComEC|nr:hypothetical protein [bacterium]MDP6527325.1 ComEC/Rec2 family competence protein [Candidatus Paceibacterota bacterium]MDP6659397.1 ComEC/Rec2 family competence protein [Candidatus Paceibacterota bacterium]|tara:strand:- start:30816 stop:32279 length:1464 start_codon:yes stop_codon:yes gene_type:complete